jgi:uncharacterized protein (TIGR00251 family)
MANPDIETKITIRVQPNADRNEFLGLSGDVLRLKIAAPPLKGRANKELVDFLSRHLITKGSSHKRPEPPSDTGAFTAPE